MKFNINKVSNLTNSQYNIPEQCANFSRRWQNLLFRLLRMHEINTNVFRQQHQSILCFIVNLLIYLFTAKFSLSISLSLSFSLCVVVWALCCFRSSHWLLVSSMDLLVPPRSTIIRCCEFIRWLQRLGHQQCVIISFLWP